LGLWDMTGGESKEGKHLLRKRHGMKNKAGIFWNRERRPWIPKAMEWEGK